MSASRQLTKEYRLRRAMASLLGSLSSHGDHKAALTALSTVYPEAASRLKLACEGNEDAAGILLSMGVSSEEEFSVLDQMLVGSPMAELPRIERLIAQLHRLEGRRPD